MGHLFVAIVAEAIVISPLLAKKGIFTTTIRYLKMIMDVNHICRNELDAINYRMLLLSHCSSFVKILR